MTTFDTSKWAHIANSPAYLSDTESIHTDGRMLLICPRSAQDDVPCRPNRLDVIAQVRTGAGAQTCDWTTLMQRIKTECDDNGENRTIVSLNGVSVRFDLERLRSLLDAVHDYSGLIRWELVPSLAKGDVQTHMLVLVGDTWRAGLLPLTEPADPVLLAREGIAS